MAKTNLERLQEEGLVLGEVPAQAQSHINDSLTPEDVEELIRIRKKLGAVDTRDLQFIF